MNTLKRSLILLSIFFTAFFTVFFTAFFTTEVFMQSSFSAAPSSENALNDYLQIQGYLAQDTFQGVHESAKLFQNDSKALGNPKITEAVKALVEAKDLTSARVAFMPLSELIKDWAKKNHPKGLIIAYCPMKEAHWLQKKGPIQNPYYGKEMLECGVVE